MSRFPENFKALSQELQIIIKRTFDKQEVYSGSPVDMYLEEKINAIYLSENIDDHISLITPLFPSIRYITGYQNFINLFERCNYEDQLKLIDLVLDIIKNCYSYVYADDIQNHILTHLIKYCNEEKTIQLLDGINNNNQFYDRREYRLTKHMLVHHCNAVLKNDFNYSKYTNLKLS
ncbi:hypothetical protein ACE3MZ_13030 [Paenibacillus sp. WLX1005]|uniref:hypothetical protein n=1 Tax=Paenibacillus sp. WLX1005 TaxID=3243766 RepID=UPI00398444EA